MLKTILFVSFGLLFTSICNAQDTSAEVSVDFKIDNFGFTVDGTFTKAAITADFKSEDISQWTLTGSVKVGSIFTDNKKRDSHLLEEDYFNADIFPEILLEAKRFEKVSDHTYNVTVNLTIKGITKKRTIPIEIMGVSENVELKSDFEINRRDFNVGDRSLVLSNTVRISVAYAIKN